MSPKSLNIVVAGGGTGGHVQPAIAVIDWLRQNSSVKITWIGSYAGYEREVAQQRGIEFVPIPTGKLRRYLSLHTLLDALRVPAGVVSARWHLRRIRPDVVFSTGGFVSVPTMISAWMAGIPGITHEQTATFGLANRINARFAQRIALAYGPTLLELGKHQSTAIVTGNPVRAELMNGNRSRAVERFGVDPAMPVLYVTGGSLGAQAVNSVILSMLPEITQHCSIIHQCGPIKANGDFPRLVDGRNSLPEAQRGRYFVQERFGDELADIYALADLVISRAGAGTIAELALLGKPSVLIPLPGSAGDEQTRNARILSDVEGALLMPQAELTTDSLRRAVLELLGDRARLAAMGDRARSVSHPDAAERLAAAIIELGTKSAREPGDS